MIRDTYRLAEPPICKREFDALNRGMDRFRYTYFFEVLPTGKVGQPDEGQHTVIREVIVKASGLNMRIVKQRNKSIPNAAQRMVFCLAIKALVEGRCSSELDDQSLENKIDLATVEIPSSTFQLDLPGPMIGFHAITQR